MPRNESEGDVCVRAVFLVDVMIVFSICRKTPKAWFKVG